MKNNMDDIISQLKDDIYFKVDSIKSLAEDNRNCQNIELKEYSYKLIDTYSTDIKEIFDKTIEVMKNIVESEIKNIEDQKYTPEKLAKELKEFGFNDLPITDSCSDDISLTPAIDKYLSSRPLSKRNVVESKDIIKIYNNLFNGMPSHRDNDKIDINNNVSKDNDNTADSTNSKSIKRRKSRKSAVSKKTVKERKDNL